MISLNAWKEQESKPFSEKHKMHGGSILFRVDGSEKIGMGHVNRCLNLAHAALKQGAEVRFVHYGDEGAAKRIHAAGFLAQSSRMISLAQQATEVGVSDLTEEIVVMDFIHHDTLAEHESMPLLLAAWRAKVSRVVLIDGSANQALRKYSDCSGFDIVIAPYAGELLSREAPFMQLYGASYAILGEPYQQLPDRITRVKADRILVTCGGADPYRITAKIIKSLDLIKNFLQIQVVVGPLFEPELTALLNQLVEHSHHTIKLIEAPDNLSALMQWSDIAIATSGLTKYELAATGTPMVSISMSNAHEAVNQSFLNEQTSISLGVYSQVTKMKLAQTVFNLLSNFELRENMAIRGQTLVDGQGTRKVLDAIDNSPLKDNK